MPIQFVAGDLFANGHRAEALQHGCNCQGSMGAGIAKRFRERYPKMYEEYRARCKADPRLFNLGDAWLWKEDASPWVFNLGTQEGFWHARASYEALEQSLGNMLKQADQEEIAKIAIPRIGVGYGGLSWKKVRAIVERVFATWAGTLVVYEEYLKEQESVEKGPRPLYLDRYREQILAWVKEGLSDRAIAANVPRLRHRCSQLAGTEWGTPFI